MKPFKVQLMIETHRDVLVMAENAEQAASLAEEIITKEDENASVGSTETVELRMNIGDVVIPNQDCLKRGKPLHCGSGTYTHAIVASLDPFVLVSSEGDMLWSCSWVPHEVTALCQASEAVQRVVADRLERWKADQK